MPAARYWRVVGVETYTGGDLELSELHMYDTAGRLDATATLTSTVAPTAGALSALQDGDLGTACRFAGSALRAGGFALMWDFGGPQSVSRLKFAAPDARRGLVRCIIQYSSDAVSWTGAIEICDILPVVGDTLSDFVVWRGSPAQMNPDDVGAGVTVTATSVAGTFNGRGARGYAAAGDGCQFEVSSISHAYVIVGVGTPQAITWDFPGGDAFGWAMWLATGDVFNSNKSNAYAGAVDIRV